MMNITISSFFKSLTMFKFFALLLVLLWVVSDHMLLINTVWAAPVYLAMCSNATEFAAMEEYDYIIVGGGTAGCPLAATLSQKYRVILLERGGVGEGVATIANEQGFMYTLMDVDELESAAQAFTSEDGVANARGRVLGGSSAINAGFYSRAGEDYIREAGWDVALVNESYQWVENAVVFRPALRQWQTAFRDGLVEAGVWPYNGFTLDHILGTKIGGTTFDRHGKRHSSADLLQNANKDNINVVLHSVVTRILFNYYSPETGVSRPRAYGVEFTDRDGNVHVAVLNSEGGGEVIVSSGALGSPQLLLLSGIGPREHLASLGIPVVLDLPGVGKGMSDNPRNGIAVISPVPLEYSLIQVVGITPSGSFIEASSNAFRIPGGDPSLPNARYVNVGSIIEKVAGPLSNGELRLRTVDVRDNPSVRFNYFQNPQDLQSCVEGLRTIGQLLQTSPMKSFTYRFLGPPLPSNTSDDGLMEAFCRSTVSTIWHYHGGCQVGRVVNHLYQVQGVDSLRVIDGSTFNISPGTNPQATVMMLGRYMGLKILEERDLATLNKPNINSTVSPGQPN